MKSKTRKEYVALSPQQVKEMLDKHFHGKRTLTVAATCEAYNISESTFYNHVDETRSSDSSNSGSAQKKRRKPSCKRRVSAKDLIDREDEGGDEEEADQGLYDRVDGENETQAQDALEPESATVLKLGTGPNGDREVPASCAICLCPIHLGRSA